IALALALVYILEGLFDPCLGTEVFVSGFRTEVFVSGFRTEVFVSGFKIPDFYVHSWCYIVSFGATFNLDASS
ncbi:hypothetical protein Bpfe_028198, partial [Biomphalaria pfeifferi]